MVSCPDWSSDLSLFAAFSSPQTLRSEFKCREAFSELGGEDFPRQSITDSPLPTIRDLQFQTDISPATRREVLEHPIGDTQLEINK
jgi:hypothetical protein